MSFKAMTMPFLKKQVLPLLFFFNIVSFSLPSLAHSGFVVMQTDFGLKDGAVSAMRGVMTSVDRSLVISDLTNEITPYNIWEAAYRLHQTAPYWPKGTVFVSVVDPGVGTKRKSIVALTNNGQFFVTPDNGTLTLIADTIGIKEVRVIDETKNRLKGSNDSYTFYGRDVYGYTAARLASGKINFEEVGPKYNNPLVKIAYQKPFIENNELHGTITILDPQYGNLWTNISREFTNQFGMQIGNKYLVKIYDGKSKVYEAKISYQNTFGEVPKGDSLIYTNSLMNLAVGTNQENFSHKYNVTSGPNWHIEIIKN
jgi:S-adenosylmethionine hydrolase